MGETWGCLMQPLAMEIRLLEKLYDTESSVIRVISCPFRGYA